MTQISDGSYVVPYEIDPTERLIRQSRNDVEEISRQGQALNPINLFVLGSKFRAGRLFLTDRRLFLLPFSERAIARAQVVEEVGHGPAGQPGLEVPRPQIDFERELLQVPIRRILAVDPFQKPYFIHPTLRVHCAGTSLRFKFAPGESPEVWAEAIGTQSGCRIERPR